jgi:hypothetical protein
MKLEIDWSNKFVRVAGVVLTVVAVLVLIQLLGPPIKYYMSEWADYWKKPDKSIYKY